MTAPDIPHDYLIRGVEVLEGNVLGEGAYGVVKLGKYFSLPCAVKKLKASMFPRGLTQLDQQSEFILQSFYNECEKLCRIRHPNIVQFLGAYVDKQSHLPVLVMELMHESLSRLLHRTNTLPLYLEVNICHDVAQALAYLHSFQPAIVHRDLSSNNIMISEEHRAKVTDLGVAKVAQGTIFNWDNTPAPGTLAYMPPEVRKIPADLSPAMDIFALGVNAVQIKTHKFPQPGPDFTSGVLGFTKIVPEKERRKQHLAMIPHTHPLRTIALDCLKDSPRDRPSALRLCHKFEKIESAAEYQESMQIAKLKDGTTEDVMQQISDLEQKVEQFRSELSLKEIELERLNKALVRERQITADLLAEKAMRGLTPREDSTEEPSDIPKETKKDEPRKKKSKSFNFLPKIRKKSRSSNKESCEELDEQLGCDIDVPPSPGPTVERQCSTTSQPSSNGFCEISSDMVQEPEEKTERDGVNRLRWHSQPSLPDGLHGSTLRVHECGDRLYICGGAYKDGTPNKSIYYCSTQNLTHWTKVTAGAPQYYCGSAIISEELVLIGGLNSSGDGCTGVLSSYEPKAQLWVSRLPPLITPRSSSAVAVCGNYLVVVGGQNEDGETVGTVEVLHIPSKSWETAAGLPIKVAGQSVAMCNDTVYLLGGTDGSICLQSVYAASIESIISSCHRFALFAGTDRAGRVWKQVCDCPFPLMVAVANHNQLLALGGTRKSNAADDVLVDLIWVFDESRNVWTQIQNMSSPRRLCGVAVLSDNSMLVIGGEPNFNHIDFTELFM